MNLGDGAEGAEVTGLLDGSPAQQAKLQAGDRILAVDGARIVTSQELAAAIRGKRPGIVVKLSIARGDDELVQAVTLGTRGGGAIATPQVRPIRARALPPLCNYEVSPIFRRGHSMSSMRISVPAASDPAATSTGSWSQSSH